MTELLHHSSAAWPYARCKHVPNCFFFWMTFARFTLHWKEREGTILKILKHYEQYMPGSHPQKSNESLIEESWGIHCIYIIFIEYVCLEYMYTQKYIKCLLLYSAASIHIHRTTFGAPRTPLDLWLGCFSRCGRLFGRLSLFLAGRNYFISIITGWTLFCFIGGTLGGSLGSLLNIIPATSGFEVRVFACFASQLCISATGTTINFLNVRILFFWFLSILGLSWLSWFLWAKSILWFQRT